MKIFISTRKQKAKQGHGHISGNAEQVASVRNKLLSGAINFNSFLPWFKKKIRSKCLKMNVIFNDMPVVLVKVNYQSIL